MPRRQRLPFMSGLQLGMLTFNENLCKGYGSILRIFSNEVKPPYLTHRFYTPKDATALQSLTGDWNTVLVHFSDVAQRRTKDVEIEACTR